MMDQCSVKNINSIQQKFHRNTVILFNFHGNVCFWCKIQNYLKAFVLLSMSCNIYSVTQFKTSVIT